jgi:NarL family two-component system response regulator LiaR
MEDAKTIRVLVVDDHLIVRAGLRALLAEVPDMEVIGEAEDGRRATELARSLRPDVILMDLVMPKVDGIEAIRQITAEHPTARILALTSFSADDKVFPALKAGALGYLLKDTEPRDLVRAIRQVNRGESSLHPSVARKVLQEFHLPDPAKKSPERLTERESEVLCQVAQGLTNREIADTLFVSEATVRTHVSNILAKLHMANRVQATLYALKTGIATLGANG